MEVRRGKSISSDVKLLEVRLLSAVNLHGKELNLHPFDATIVYWFLVSVCEVSAIVMTSALITRPMAWMVVRFFCFPVMAPSQLHMIRMRALECRRGCVNCHSLWTRAELNYPTYLSYMGYAI